MNDFKESLQVDRETSGKIIMSEQLREILITLMKGEITKKELMEKTGIGDKNTVELKIQELVSEEPNLRALYEEYNARKSTNFNGYSFRAEAISMLRTDASQSSMAERLDINRRTFSTKMKRVQEANKDNVLGCLLKDHADRQMKRQKTTPEQLININLQLDKYEQEYPVGLTKYEKRNSLEIRLENIKRVVELVEEIMQTGMTLKEINDRGIISESNYRKYKEEVKKLEIILNGRDRKEE